MFCRTGLGVGLTFLEGYSLGREVKPCSKKRNVIGKCFQY